MNRRELFSVLAGAALFTVDPERALWVPGKRLISIPKPPCPFTDMMCAGDILAFMSLSFMGGAPSRPLELRMVTHFSPYWDGRRWVVSSGHRAISPEEYYGAPEVRERPHHQFFPLPSARPTSGREFLHFRAGHPLLGMVLEA